MGERDRAQRSGLSAPGHYAGAGSRRLRIGPPAHRPVKDAGRQDGKFVTVVVGPEVADSAAGEREDVVEHAWRLLFVSGPDISLGKLTCRRRSARRE